MAQAEIKSGTLNQLSHSVCSNLLAPDFYPYPIFIVIIFSSWPMNELVNTLNTVTVRIFFLTDPVASHHDL